MAISGGGAHSGAFGKRRHRRNPVMSEINVTPMVDVMLVLLIIFMVAAPLIATGVPLDLPQTGAKPINVDQRPITIAIDSKGQIFLQDQPTLEPDLVTKLHGLAKQGFDERIYVRGDRQVDYGRVASVMSTITSAGFKRVALVTEPATR